MSEAKELLSDQYGYCPLCNAPGHLRERRLNGNDTCIAGHTYPSAQAVPAKRETITDEYIREILKQHNYLSGAEYEWLFNRMEALTKQVESLMSGLGEAEIRCLSLTAENAKLREVIENHIAWWYKPKEHPDHSEAAYDKLREALREG